MLSLAFFIVISSFIVVLSRLAFSSSAQERLIIVNLLGQHLLFMIVMFAYSSSLPDLLDIVIVYVILNVLATVAITKFVLYGEDN